ncbi:MAG: MotA/TolQ/ExbB proton channel family protein [Opitutales bacterium]
MKINHCNSISSMRWVRALSVAAFIFLVFTSLAMAQGASAAPDDDNTMFGLIKKGGPVMIPLGIASVLALALGIERFISLKKERVLPEGFISEFGEAWASDPSGEAAEAVCDDSTGTCAHVFKAGIQWRSQGHEAIGKAIEDAGSREAEKMKRSVRPLSVIAGVCPLLGLLGTVYGMIDAFQKTADAGGAAKTSELADGIYQALISTAAGLTIAIPVLLLFQWLSTRADRAIDHLDEAGTYFVAQHALSAKKPAAKPTPAKAASGAAKKTATKTTDAS